MERTAVPPVLRNRLIGRRLAGQCGIYAFNNQNSCRRTKVRTLLRQEEDGSSPHDPPTEFEKPPQLQARLVRSIQDVGQEAWDACHDGSNPFVCFEFLKALEESRSVDPTTGWLPQHLVVSCGEGSDVVACVPLYLKTHSYGEYVFDSSWAQFYDRHVTRPSYYPKLQSCVPFTPATGPRLLIRQNLEGNQWNLDESTIRNAVVRVMVTLPQELGVSSMHVTFNTENEWNIMAKEGLGFHQRLGVQFHWHNDKVSHGITNGVFHHSDTLNASLSTSLSHSSNIKYESFEEFLSTMQQKRRKAIRQERKRVASYPGLCIRRLTGDEVQGNSALWDAFYDFYLDTIDRKWGVPYLTRDFFQLVSQRMADKIMLVVAEECDTSMSSLIRHHSKRKGRTIIAAALNFIGSDAIYGRNWGCAVGDSIKGLHFELCYYQAIEHAILTGISRVEAGAQGEHKLSRGYVPQLTYSNHYISHPGVRDAIESFLRQERMEIEAYAETASVHLSPYKV